MTSLIKVLREAMPVIAAVIRRPSSRINVALNSLGYAATS